MSDSLRTYAKDILKEGLAQCTEGEQLIFKRMYSHRNLELSIAEVVDQMEPEKLEWAIEQVWRTLDGHKKALK